MGFSEAIRVVLFKKYATFSGRASRSEYWWFMLFQFLITSVLLGANAFLTLNPSPDKVHFFPILSIVGLIVGLIFLLPRISVTVRRLHDINASGWWCLILVLSSLLSLTPFAIIYLSLATVFPLSILTAINIIQTITSLLSFILVLVLIKKGTKGANRFGPDPVKVNVDADIFS